MNRLVIYQNQNGYRYNSDTILLYGFMSAFALSGKVLDVGFGSGILALLIKRDSKECEVSGVDIQKDNYTLALHNVSINALEVEFVCEDFAKFEAKEFDAIVSNPPFYHEGVQQSKDIHVAISRYSRYLPLENFVKKSYQILKNRGRLFFCYDAKQVALVLEALKKHKLNPEIIQFVHTKKDKEASIVLIYARKNSNALTKVLPPLILHDKEGYTKEAQEAYEKADVISQECPI